MSKIILLLPQLDEIGQYVYRGHIYISERYSKITIFITKWSESKEKLNKNYRGKNKSNDVYGYCNRNQTKIKCKSFREDNYFEFTHNGDIEFKKLIIHNKHVSIGDCIMMFYDYNTLKGCESMPQLSSDDMFFKLHSLIQSEQHYSAEEEVFVTNFHKPVWFSSTMFGQHLLNYIELMIWLTSIKKQKRISLKQGNVILAIITDIIIGYLILNMLSEDKEHLSSTLMSMLEKLVNYLYSLLKWLMGAPAGLKLNNAFNKMLGKYFSYHIQLWWLFLDVSGEKLNVILDIYHYIGYLGFTFQAAIIADMICIATFHSYCIYVYAARLFNIQVSGLIALMRLFVGRKYNPLRGGIDSCEYTNQELFVGTVAFTILLFLLPTTAMYYIVFTLFRLMSLTVQHVLSKTIHFIQTLPLYVILLWCIRSPKVAGNIYIEVMSEKECSPLILKVKVLTLPFGVLVNNSKLPIEAQNPVVWNNLLSNIFRGKQII